MGLPQRTSPPAFFPVWYHRKLCRFLGFSNHNSSARRCQLFSCDHVHSFFSCLSPSLGPVGPRIPTPTSVSLPSSPRFLCSWTCSWCIWQDISRPTTFVLPCILDASPSHACLPLSKHASLSCTQTHLSHAHFSAARAQSLSHIFMHVTDTYDLRVPKKFIIHVSYLSLSISSSPFSWFTHPSSLTVT